MNFHPGSITWGRSADGRLVPVAVARAHRPEGTPRITPQQREAVVAAFNAGKTYGQIAHDLDISRNAIAGIIFRARQGGKVKREKNPRQMRAVFVPIETIRKEPPKVIEPGDTYVASRIAFFELQARHCRWPLWKGDVAFSEKLFCGNAVEEGKPYCAHCNEMSVAPRRTDSFDKKHGFFKLAKMGRRR